jgi:hypothetical protein
MNRYVTPLEIDTTKTVPYYTPPILSDVPPEDVPFYYTAQDGDRLDTISNLFYKTPSNWWIIAKANNFADGSISVPVGTRLFIPNV